MLTYSSSNLKQNYEHNMSSLRLLLMNKTGGRLVGLMILI